MVKAIETKRQTSQGGLEPPTFRLTVERANRLRHWDPCYKRTDNRGISTERRFKGLFFAHNKSKNSATFFI